MRSLIPTIPNLPDSSIRHLYQVLRLCVEERPAVLEDPDWREAIDVLQRRLTALGDNYPPIEAEAAERLVSST